MWGVVSAGQMYCFGDMVVKECGRSGIIVGKKEMGRQEGFLQKNVRGSLLIMVMFPAGFILDKV